MKNFHLRFPTPTLSRIEAKMSAFLAKGLIWARSQDQNSLPKAETLAFAIEFTQGFHRLYQEWQQISLRQHSEPIQCSKGCSQCCQHFPMSVEPIEAILLYSKLRERDDLWTILEALSFRVQKYSQLLNRAEPSGLSDEDLDDVALQDYFKLGLRCPFLDSEGACSVHEYRPISCRMYFSFTEGKYCTPEYLHSEHNRSFHLCLPDLMEEDLNEISQVFAQLELGESLYGSLLILNTLEGHALFTKAEQ